MASAKPVIHGRDHLPGGADEIPRLADLITQLTPAQEVLLVASSIVTGLTGANQTWSHYDGQVLLDLSDATQPEILTDGVYGFTLNWQWSGSLSDGIYMDASLGVVQSLYGYPPGGPPITQSSMVNAGALTGDTVNASVSTTAIMLAGDSLLVNAFNGDSVDHAIEANITVVKIYGL